MKDKAIQFAIVGFGRIGKRHAALVKELEGASLAAVCDINGELKKECSQVPFFENLGDMLTAMPEIEVVNVCTPNGLHAEHCIQALRSGKHVICEKPMALTKKDCEAMIFESLKARKHIFCVMQNRYSPPSVWLKSLMEEQRLGAIYLVQISCYWNRDDRYYKPNDWHGTKKVDGGVLFTQFSHFIDTMYWLFGDISSVKATFANFNHQYSTEFEDTGIVQFDFLRGGKGNINFSTSVWQENLESSLTIIGSKGTVKVGGQYMERVEYCKVENYQMPALSPANPPNDYGGYKGSAANHVFVIQNAMDVLNGKGSIHTNALEGLKVVEIIEKIYENRIV